VKELLALLPTEKVLSLTLHYLATDPELLKAFVYIQSEELPDIHKVVEYLKEYKDVSAFMCKSLKPQSDTEYVCSVSTGVCISLFQCLKFITDYGVDVYALIYEVNYILGLPPLPTTNTTHMGVGIYGLIDDVIALLPLNDLKTLIDNKLETRDYLKTLLTALKSPVFVVSIHWVYLNFVSCCLCYVHTSV